MAWLGGAPFERMTNRNLRLGWIAGAVVLAFGVSTLLRGPQGLTGPFELFGQIREYQKTNRALETEISEKKERLRRLEEGSNEAELEVKKRLKYLKRGETQMVLPPGANATPPAVAPGTPAPPPSTSR
jgi:cell division protein FtsB